MNYLLFIIDSLNYKHLKNSPIELMPFLRELKLQGLCCEEMFSQAPYTEAAVMNLYCGQDVLQDNGYLFRFKNAKRTIFEEMHDAGYITYYNSYQPQCYPSSLRRGIDYLYYNVGYDQGALWSYRICHYSDLYKKGDITEKDYENLEDILDDNFSEWLIFIDSLANNDESINMISSNASSYNPIIIREMVDAEYKAFKINHREYITELLIDGQEHRLFKIPAYFQDGKIKLIETRAYITNEFQCLFKKIKAMNTKLNLRNCKGMYKGTFGKLRKLLNHPSKTTYKDFLKSMYLALNEIKDFDLYQRIGKKTDSFKNAPSGRTHIDHYIRWANEHRCDGRHFACIHIDDIHNPEVFFTYDTDNTAILEAEKKAAEELLDQIPSSYYGSLTHDLSLRYMDNLLKYLYSELGRAGVLEDTCIIICADHGFSFSGNPLRDSFVNNLYLENYNIPCVITGAGMCAKSIDKLRTSKDIPATICDMAMGNIPEAFTGHSLFEDMDYGAVHIEYCGGGCPDLTRRDLKIAAFDEQYFVGTLCALQDESVDDAITEIYDLSVDPLQLNNLNNRIYDEAKVNFLISEIERRRTGIRNSICQ